MNISDAITKEEASSKVVRIYTALCESLPPYD